MDGMDAKEQGKGDQRRRGTKGFSLFLCVRPVCFVLGCNEMMGQWDVWDGFALSNQPTLPIVLCISPRGKSTFSISIVKSKLPLASISRKKERGEQGLFVSSMYIRIIGLGWLSPPHSTLEKKRQKKNPLHCQVTSLTSILTYSPCCAPGQGRCMLWRRKTTKQTAKGNHFVCGRT